MIIAVMNAVYINIYDHRSYERNMYINLHYYARHLKYTFCRFEAEVFLWLFLDYREII